MSKSLTEKLKQLPAQPGVYFFKDTAGKIIYIGKAAVLKNRVSSYFQNSQRDPKTALLVEDIADLDLITVSSEVEALFLESEFIKRYRPKYNIDWKDEKNFIYIKISDAEFPVVSYVRRPLDDKSHYFGPFTSSDAVKRAMRQLRKVFPYVTHEHWPARGCLQFHLGLCPGPEEGAVSAAEYRRNIRNLMLDLRGQKDKLVKQFERDMAQAAGRKDYEAAALARDRLRDLLALGKQMIFGDRESFDLSRDHALVGLAEQLALADLPRRIEAYDISHIQGTDNVASMVVFQDGVPNRDEYRRFKMRLRGNDDFGHMREVIRRRFSPANLAKWPRPDLLLIDGGQGQLAAALSVLDEVGLSIPALGLAKREEEIIVPAQSHPRPSSLPESVEGRSSPGSTGGSKTGSVHEDAWIRQHGDFTSILLPKSSPVLQLLQRVRDEAHRFAITYHSLLRAKRQTKSVLDDVPGIGPATRKKLIKVFGSLRGVKQADEAQLAAVIGPAKAKQLRAHL